MRRGQGHRQGHRRVTQTGTSEADAEDSDDTSKETVVTKTQEPTGPTQNITLNIVNFDMFSLLYIFHIL